MSQDTDTADVPALVGDSTREGLVDRLRVAIGDALLESVVRPGQDVWVRVRLDAWQQVGLALRDHLDFDYFCFLSAIDWMPSPYGRGEDDPTAAATRARRHDPPGRRRWRHPLPAARPCALTDRERRHHAQGRPRRRPRRADLGAGVRRRQLARARGLRDVRHHLRRPPRPAQAVPAARLRGLPPAQGLPAARPHRQAVAGHRRRRADAGRRRGRRAAEISEAPADAAPAPAEGEA